MIIITIILAVWACVSPFFYFRLFTPEKTEQMPVKTVKKKKKSKNITKEERNQEIFLENLENFHGVGSRQRRYVE